jgi:hypothetical protein
MQKPKKSIIVEEDESSDTSRSSRMSKLMERETVSRHTMPVSGTQQSAATSKMGFRASNALASIQQF